MKENDPQELADALRACTGAVSVTVKDGDKTAVSPSLVAEASSLGWRPGQVKDSVRIDKELFNFARTERNDEGELLCYKYVSPTTGRVLTVFND